MADLFQQMMASRFGGVQEEDPTFWGELKNAVPRSLGQTVQGVGQIAEDLGWEDNFVKNYGQRVVDRNPTQINSLEDIADHPMAAFGSAVGNAAGFLGPGLALKGAMALRGIGTAGQFAAQTGLAGLPSYGGIRERQLAEGHDGPVDMLTAGAGALAVGAIENLGGAQRMLGMGLGRTGQRAMVEEFGKTPWRTVGKTAFRGALEEGAEELAQNPIEQMAAYQDPRSAEGIDETLFGGAMGALGGLGFGGAIGGYRGMQHRGLRDELRAGGYLGDTSTPTDLLAGMENRDIANYASGFQDEAFRDHMARINPAALLPDGAVLGQEDVVPTQQFINQGLGVRNYSDKEHNRRQAEYSKMFNAGSGVFTVDPETQQERELSTAELWDLRTLEIPRQQVAAYDPSQGGLPPITTVGEAVSVLELASRAQASGQAIQEGSELHQRVLEADALLKAGGLSYRGGQDRINPNIGHNIDVRNIAPLAPAEKPAPTKQVKTKKPSAVDNLVSAINEHVAAGKLTPEEGAAAAAELKAAQDAFVAAPKDQKQEVREARKQVMSKWGTRLKEALNEGVSKGKNVNAKGKKGANVTVLETGQPGNASVQGPAAPAAQVQGQQGEINAGQTTEAPVPGVPKEAQPGKPLQTYELVTLEGKKAAAESAMQLLSPRQLEALRHHKGTNNMPAEKLLEMRGRLLEMRAAAFPNENEKTREREVDLELAKIAEESGSESGGSLSYVGRAMGVAKGTAQDYVNKALARLQQFADENGLRDDELYTAMGLNPDEVAAYIETVSPEQAAQAGLSFRGKTQRAGAEDATSANDDFDTEAGWDGSNSDLAQEGDTQMGAGEDAVAVDTADTTTDAVDAIAAAEDVVGEGVADENDNRLSDTGEVNYDEGGVVVTYGDIQQAADLWKARTGTELPDNLKKRFAQLMRLARAGAINERQFTEEFNSIRASIPAVDEAPAPQKIRRDPARIRELSGGEVGSGAAEEKTEAKPAAKVATKRKPKVDKAEANVIKQWNALAAVRGLPDWSALTDAQRQDLRDSKTEAGLQLVADYVAEQVKGTKFSEDVDLDIAGTLWEMGGVASKYFKRWFGNSKVVDAKGKPLLVYHGTDATFDEFSDAKLGSKHKHESTGLGHHFTDAPRDAKQYGKAEGYYLRLNNPLVVTFMSAGHSRILKDAAEKGGRKVAAALAKKGYDGIVVKNSIVDETGTTADMFIVFSAKQNAIKAENNRGTFDESPNVRKSEGTGSGTTVESVRGVLNKLFFSPARLDAVVKVYATQAEASAGNAALSEAKGKVKGFTTADGKVGLIAENIPAGNELGVALHEIGVHLGMEKLIGAGNMKWLADRINDWRQRTDNSVESRVAKWAYDKAIASSSGAEHTQEELIAYMVEGLVNEGITPQAAGTSQAHQWFRKLWAAAKAALRKLGFKNPNFNGQNLVDLAYGAADLELQGAWHGTAADFRNFNHDYMNTGEGAQAFGWGTYLAQRVGIAKGYWKADTERKGMGKDERVFVDGKPVPRSSPEWFAARLIEANGVDGATKFVTGRLNATIKRFGKDSDLVAEERELLTTIARLGKNPDAISVEYAAPEGSLMRVATNVRDHEFLDWDKPLSEQSEHVQKALEAIVPKKKGGVLGWLYDDPQAKSGDSLYKQLTRHFGSDKAASEYLDSIGIKGIKFLDQPSRDAVDNPTLNQIGHGDIAGTYYDYDYGPVKISANSDVKIGNSGDVSIRAAIPSKVDGPARFDWVFVSNLKGLEGKENELRAAVKGFKPVKTRNLVIFNDKNIQRVSTQVGARRDSGSIKFSEERGAPPAHVPFQEAQIKEQIARLKDRAKDISKGLLHKVVFMHDLVEIALKEGLSTAKGFNELMGQKDQIRNRLEERVDRIMQRISQLSDKTTVENFLRDSTISKKWGYDDNPQKRAADPGMKARFDGLSKEGQAVVRDVFQYGEDTYNQIVELAQQEVRNQYATLLQASKSAEETAKLEKDMERELRRVAKVLPKLQGPYAPLKRFGDHVVVGMSKAYLDAKNRGDTKALEQYESDPSGRHYIVEFYENAGEAQARKRQLDSYFAGGNVIAANKQKAYASIDELPWSGIAKVKTAIENDPDMNNRNAMMKLVTDLYLQMMAESSARKSEITRKGTYGAGDMFRAFADHGRSGAHFIASLSKSAEISKAITAMKNEAHNESDSAKRDAKTRVYNEIAARHAQYLDYKETPWADKTMRVSSLYMLLTSPAYYLTNATQTYMVALPILGGRFKGRAFPAITQAYKDIGKFITKMGHELDFNDMVKAGKITQDEANMLEDLRSKGKLDITIAADLGRWAEGKMDQGIVAKVLDKMNGSIAKVEALNRITTALAAYRLSGGSVEYAGKIVDQTQGNYGGSNAPRFFAATGAHKVVLQFRKYQLIQISLIGRLLHDAVKGASPEERAVARRAFAWMFAQQLVFTGIKGAPIPAVALMLAGAIGGDDDKDWERNLTKWIGDDDAAALLIRGVPAWMGVDLSGRIGMGNAFSPLPFAEIPKDRDTYAKFVTAALGPAIGGLGMNLVDGLGRMANGQFYKGTELLMPKGIKDAMQGYRMATQGITDNRGDTKLSPDEITFFDGFMKGIGLPTTTVSEFQKSRGDLIELSKHFKEKSNSMKSAYANAYKSNDTAEMAELRQEWKEVQEAKKRWAAEMQRRGFKDPKLVEDLKVQPLSNLLKAPHEKAKREKPWASIETR